MATASLQVQTSQSSFMSLPPVLGGKTQREINFRTAAWLRLCSQRQCTHTYTGPLRECRAEMATLFASVCSKIIHRKQTRESRRLCFSLISQKRCGGSRQGKRYVVVMNGGGHGLRAVLHNQLTLQSVDSSLTGEGRDSCRRRAASGARAPSRRGTKESDALLTLMEDWWDAPERHLRSDWAPSQGFKKCISDGTKCCATAKPGRWKAARTHFTCPSLEELIRGICQAWGSARWWCIAGQSQSSVVVRSSQWCEGQY